ncbi:hypothetical protein POM88_012529 [Heracleum sosnowskyi]|uniref:Uncharacterized protein n=1 Tax=Heracleum sosnowskyi TaxID=360622 RepID=A0AAD8IY69_9APIA|nr:hypothetical protein POM88_012529 [Heracleum sosnowskyi]
MRRFLNKGSCQDSLATPSPEPPPYTATPPVPSASQGACWCWFSLRSGSTRQELHSQSGNLQHTNLFIGCPIIEHVHTQPVYPSGIGGIDEASLDPLSLITKMTSKGLLSRFGDNRGITPRDYLEIALRPFQGSKRDVAAKNEVGQ